MNGNKKMIVLMIVAIALGVTAGVFAALTSKVIFTIQTQYSGGSGLGTTLDNLNLDYSISLTSGTGANQANVIYSASRTLADDANEVLDFYASGTLKDAFGTNLTMTRIKLLVIYNTSTEATLRIGGGVKAVNLFVDLSDKLDLPPGGKFLYCAPDATGLLITTDKDLNLLHGGQGTAALVYKIIAIGID